MAEEQFDIQAFSKRLDAVAAVVAGEELFGLLKRSLSLPPRWVALVTGEGGATSIRGPGGQLAGRDVGEVMFVRLDASELTFRFKGITSSDGYQCQASVVLDVHVVNEKSELVAFRKTVMGTRREATVESLAQPLHWQVRRAVVAYAEKCPAGVLVDGRKAEAFGTILKDKAAAACFAAGLSVERCGALRITSPEWQSVRQEKEALQAQGEKEAARRQLRETIEAAQHKHVQHVTELLEHLKTLSDQNPELGVGDLIRTFSEQERGELYEALWSAETAEGRTRWVVAAAGRDLLFFEPGLWKSPAKQITLSDAGSLRSVQTVGQEERVCLLVGAARGVHVVDVDKLDEHETYLFEAGEGRTIRGGVNAATLTAGHVLGTHSEVGLLRWELGKPAASEQMIAELTAGAKAVRAIQRFGNDLWLSVDDGVLRLPDGILVSSQGVIYTGSSVAITALSVCEQGVFAGNGRGDVLRWAPAEPGDPEVLHRGRGRPVETVRVCSSAGVDRLLFTDGSPVLNAKALGDTFVCGYDGSGQMIRRAEIADDVFVGLNETRDRVLCWLPHQPAEPAAVLPLAQQLAHRVQDVCLVPTV